MTLGELSQLSWLMKEIELDTERLRKLEAKMAPGGQAFDRIPSYGKGVPSDRVGETASEMADLRDRIRENRQRCVIERDRLMAYILSVGDSQIRLMLSLKYLDGMSWGGVAKKVGGGNTADGCRKRCKRYVESADAE